MDKALTTDFIEMIITSDKLHFPKPLKARNMWLFYFLNGGKHNINN